MNPTVLYVEDEEDYRILVRRILGRVGLQVKSAETRADALRALATECPSVLLLDINLPDGTGYDLCTELRRDSHWDKLPIIMLTVRRRPEEWLRGFSCGASDYIAKPIVPKELTERVFACRQGEYVNSFAYSEPSTEYKLVRAVVAGNVPAFEVLVQKYRKRLVESLGSMVRNEDEMEDVIAHAFATAFDRLDEFRGESSFFTWLYRIASNYYTTASRKLPPLSLDDIVEKNEPRILAPYEEGESEDESFASREVFNHALQALEQVPQPYKQALEMYCLEDLSYETISNKLGIPEGTVMSRLYKARKLMQSAWANTPTVYR
jgi:RNA polymerase sigma-70 factor, ECF subfamily